MKSIMSCAIAFLLACCLTAQAAEKREQTYDVGADVDARGHITATQFDPDVPAAIATVLASAVKQWQFVPATLHGQPVSAHTFITTRLQALPNAKGQYDVRINFVGNGPRIDTRFPPRYPRDALRERQSAFMILDAIVQPDGHLTNMTANSRFADWPVLTSFKEAVLEAARHWRAVPEQVDGQAVATHLHVPVNFRVDDQTFTSQQIKALRGAAREEAAATNAEAAQPAIPMPSNQEVALDSPLQPRAVAAISNAP